MANKVILIGTKKKFEKVKGHRPEELPEARLWSKAMILIEIAEPSLRRATFDEQGNSETRLVVLDLVEEERELARVREEAMKLRIAKKYKHACQVAEFQRGRSSTKKDRTSKKANRGGDASPGLGRPIHRYQIACGLTK
ncbi:Transposon Ty3-I Gag-Pol polyprotein [Canna indica]|uniref:Transposon Ty3-I Gag-Pol polyprotein n=1 Tax=Canna indica TaxID=4628 RepID=A0AAQ3KU50_9LILI|nr:Transposon Ty3-I Gag-Pol polyprotein [Canna indica]